MRFKKKDEQATGETDEMTSASRSNKFDVLDMTERGLEVEELNAVYVVREIVETNVDSGAAKSVWLVRQKGVTTTEAMKTKR